MDAILIVNRSSRPDAEIQNIIPAMQAQFDQDFGPVWGISVKLEFGRDETAWHLKILDHTDIEGAGGYHVDIHGRVSGKVFWLDALEAGESPSIDASHEAMEMAADPSAGTDPGRFVDLQGPHAGLQCLPEVCDAVESDALGYTHPGADGKPVLLSDFVTPRYFFMDGPDPSGSFDFRGHLSLPAPALLQGGYLGIYDPSTGRWSQISDFDRATGRRSRRSLRHGRTAWATGRSNIK